MWPYWLLLALPAIGLIAPRRLERRVGMLAWILLALVFVLAIGLRHEVGGDWYTYLVHLKYVSAMSLREALGFDDPGYYFLNWVVAWFGGGIYWVNLACGAILVSGIVVFARRQPLPWLAAFVAVPYLVIVVGMGYSRQASALGFVLLGLVALSDHRLRTFVVWVLLGTLFHKSALLLIPVAALIARRQRGWTLAWVGVAAALSAYLFLVDSVDSLWVNYVEADYHSQGGLIRVLMNTVPAVVFLLLRRRMGLTSEEDRLWSWMSLFALACIPLVMLSSTATDRVALYLIPIQMFVFARLPLVARVPRNRAYLVAGVMAYYVLVQYVWLNHATHAKYWLPYQAAWLF